MVDTAEVLQRTVYTGYGTAASIVGLPHDQFRPTDPLDPLRLLDFLGTIKATFDARPSLNFSIPAQHNDAFRYGVLDGNVVEVGDYLVGPQETVFVAAKPPLQVVVCIGCNIEASLHHQAGSSYFGAIADRSPEISEETVVFKGWPASLLYSGRGGNDNVPIPGDAPAPNWNLLMPRVPDVPIPEPGDVIVDETGRRFSLSWCEQAHLGWRMVVRQLVAD